MLINLRNKDNKLYIKDMLDIDFDMTVKQKGVNYYVQINKQYMFDQAFDNEQDAEHKMLEIAWDRNALEDELKNT